MLISSTSISFVHLKKILIFYCVIYLLLLLSLFITVIKAATVADYFYFTNLLKKLILEVDFLELNWTKNLRDFFVRFQNIKTNHLYNSTSRTLKKNPQV